jgi:hypothetical protein
VKSQNTTCKDKNLKNESETKELLTVEKPTMSADSSFTKKDARQWSNIENDEGNKVNAEVHVKVCFKNKDRKRREDSRARARSLAFSLEALQGPDFSARAVTQSHAVERDQLVHSSLAGP